MIVDFLRSRYPHFGFATYAMDPAGLVTVEAHTPDLFSATGATEHEAWSKLFDLADFFNATSGDENDAESVLD